MKTMMYIFLITPILVGCGSKVDTVEVEDATAFAATIFTYAAMLPDSDERKPVPDPEECECNGTGYLTHGDGHRTPCNCGSSCRCSNTGMTPQSSEPSEDASEVFESPGEAVSEDTETPNVSNETPTPAKRQILVFTATWCGPCQVLKGELAKMKSVGWRIGSEEDASIRIIDFDTNKSLAQQMGVKGLPTLIKLEDGVQVDSHEGYLDSFDIGRLYQGQ